MKKYFTYLFSKNKLIYAEIGKLHSCGPFKVYTLAHGKKAKSNKDFDIIQSLIEKGIVTGYKAL